MSAAFPTKRPALDPRASGFDTEDGMTLRAYIATKAMQGMLAAESGDNVYCASYRHENGNIVSSRGTSEKANELVFTREQNITRDAVALADALIAELRKEAP